MKPLLYTSANKKKAFYKSLIGLLSFVSLGIPNSAFAGPDTIARGLAANAAAQANAINIGLLSQAATKTIPTGVDVVETSGNAQIGVGSARYVATNTAGTTSYRFKSNNGRWFELINDRPLTLEMFGATGDGVSDDAPAVTALNTYIAARLNRFDPKDYTHTYVSGSTQVSLKGLHAYSNTLLTYPGVAYSLPSGGRLIALANGQTMVRTPTVSELTASSTGAIYGSSIVDFRGGGTIDCANKGSQGFVADTVSDFGQFEFTVVRCTYRRFNTTAVAASSGVTSITLADNSLAKVNDVIEIGGTLKRFYNITAVGSNNAVTIAPALDTAIATGATVVHRATGFAANDAQISKISVQATFNDIGWAIGYNKDNIFSTDLRITDGKSEWNNIGEAIVGGDAHHVNVTIMHNFDSEVVIGGGIGTEYRGVYNESMSDAQANALSPPTGGSPIGQAALSLHPLWDIEGGRIYIESMTYPTNPTSTTWRRLIRNGADLRIDNINFTSVPLSVNPNTANDYGLVEQNPSLGSTYISNLRGPTNLGSMNPNGLYPIGAGSVVKTDGSLANAYQSDVNFSSSGKWATVAIGAPKRFMSTVNGSVLDIMRSSETFPRVSIGTTDVIAAGPGTGVVDTQLQRNSAGVWQIPATQKLRSLGGLGVTPLTAAPTSPFTGMIVFADGATWDPLTLGTTHGAYAVWYTGSVWRGLNKSADGTALP